MTSEAGSPGRPVVIILAGVSGSGKTTIGSELARRLGYRFLDADSLHSPASIEKMRVGVPLSEDDRAPWLRQIARQIEDAVSRRAGMVLACSALKRAYRRQLDPRRDGGILWVFLQGSQELLAARLKGRIDHFMNPALLVSQLDLLEGPEADEHAMIVQVDASPDEIVRQISNELPST